MHGSRHRGSRYHMPPRHVHRVRPFVCSLPVCLGVLTAASPWLTPAAAQMCPGGLQHAGAPVSCLSLCRYVMPHHQADSCIHCNCLR